MKALEIILSEVAVLIPKAQLVNIKEQTELYIDEISELHTQLEKCPNLYKTEKLKEHPVIFHYFFKLTHFYICEYDRKDLLFGYTILNGDLENSEWGFSSLSEITSIPHFKISFNFREQSIEEALYTAYPDYFKKPLSLIV